MQNQEGLKVSSYGMTSRFPFIAVALAIAVGLGFGVPATGQDAGPVSPNLTPKLRDLLRQEMLSIEQASKTSSRR